jgi:hypothetical protein
MLLLFSSPPFYNDYVKLPHEDAPISPKIQTNPKFYPFFQNALGTINGTYINCCPSAVDQQATRDRKGRVTQNYLTVCGFDMVFYYMFSGWEGFASNSTMFHKAHITDFPVSPGQYYLVDAGFPSCASLHQQNINSLENGLFSLKTLENVFQAKSRASRCLR